MQKLKIYSQENEKGEKYYYINLTKLDQETQKRFYKKMLVGFKKDMQTTGHITVSNSSLTFSKTKIEMKLLDKMSGREVKVDVPMYNYSIMIWEYEKTAEDKQKDLEYINSGKSFEKKFDALNIKTRSYTNKGYTDFINNSTTERDLFEESNTGIELPF